MPGISHPHSTYADLSSVLYNMHMPRLSQKLLRNLPLIVALLIGGTIITWAYAHEALAASTGTYAWSTQDTGLQDYGAPCGPQGDCNFLCDASHVGQSCDAFIPNGGGNNQGECLGESYTYTCTYTPPPAATCTPDSSCAATTCTTGTCTATNADCTTSQIAGTKHCLLPPVTCASLGETGTYPNCVAPPASPTCADFGQVGTYPSCSAPTTCATYGLLGTYPNCTDALGDSCTVGASGIACNQAPVFNPNPSCEDTGQVGTYPNCTTPPGGGGSCTNPTVTITAVPSRINSSQVATLTVNGTGINSSCTVTDEKNVTVGTVNATSCSVSGTITTPTITTQKSYTATCDGGTANASTAKVIVNLNPNFNPF